MKITTSKKILIASYLMVSILSIIVIITTFIPVDNSGLATVCGLSWGELAIHTVVYSSKSKAENKKKIAYGMFKEMADKYSPEIVAQIFEIVARD